MDAAAVVRSYLGSFAGGDPDEIAAHVSDDFVNDHTAALGAGSVGRAEYRARLPSFLGEMVGLRYAVDDVVAEGDRCMVAYTMTARWRDERPITVRGAMHLVVRDGEIAARVDYWDSASFLLQADPDAPAALARFGIG